MLAANKIDGIKKSSFSTTRDDHSVQRRDALQQLLRVLDRQRTVPPIAAKNFRTRPWKVKIDGAVEKKQELDVDEIIKMASAGRAHLSSSLR